MSAVARHDGRCHCAWWNHSILLSRVIAAIAISANCDREAMRSSWVMSSRNGMRSTKVCGKCADRIFDQWKQGWIWRQTSHFLVRRKMKIWRPEHKVVWRCVVHHQADWTIICSSLDHGDFSHKTRTSHAVLEVAVIDKPSLVADCLQHREIGTSPSVDCSYSKLSDSRSSSTYSFSLLIYASFGNEC